MRRGYPIAIQENKKIISEVTQRSNPLKNMLWIYKFNVLMLYSTSLTRSE